MEKRASLIIHLLLTQRWFSKILNLVYILIVLSLLSGCKLYSANVYTSKYNLTQNIPAPEIKNKCVIMLIGHTNNYVNNELLYINPMFNKKGINLFPLSSFSDAGGHEWQAYNVNKTSENTEVWQIFTLSAEIGYYKLDDFRLYTGNGAELTPNKILTRKTWTAKSELFEAKAGQFIYVGMINVNATGKRDGMGSYLFGQINHITYSWESSPDNIKIIRENISELKDIEIIYQPLTVSTE